MAKRIGSYKDMSREQLIAYLETVEAGVKEMRGTIAKQYEAAQGLEAVDNYESAYTFRIMAQAGESALKAANLWAFES